MKKDIIKGGICLVGGMVIDFLGGWDIWLTSLIFLIVSDVIVGMIKAMLCKSDKSQSGGLSSASMFSGGVKKILILIMIALATLLDSVIIPEDSYIRSAVAAYYIANEALSVIENIGACGVPLPKFLYKILDSLKNKGDR